MSRFLFVGCLFSMTALLTVHRAAADVLEAEFREPPAAARPFTWWHWMNGNVTRQGITLDLEAMARVGVGGFQVFHVSDRIPPGPVGYMSDEWRAMMVHTIKEADRLGLDACLHNCAGWSSSGGPWIRPEDSMKEIVRSERQIQGDVSFSGKLEIPESRLAFYRDIAVLAFPSPAGEKGAKQGFRIEDWERKAGGNIQAGTRMTPDIVEDSRKVARGDIIPLESVVDLSDRMDADGLLRWDAPEGMWTVVRFGYTTTGATNKPSPPEGEGLECDKLSVQGARHHWENSMQKVIDDVGPLAGRTLKSVLIDSFEVGSQNWTEDFDRAFEQRRGYSMRSWMPALTGRVVASMDQTERFLRDFRRTISDLFIENYFGEMARLCRSNSMLLAVEPYNMLTDYDPSGIAAKADIPMGEWWAMEPPRWHHWSSKLASSAAHTYGRKYVGAEAFTAGGPHAAWINHPYWLKAQGDYFYTKGINRFIFHDYAHHPSLDAKPGMTMGPHGFQFNRGNTWWEQGRAWLKYLARCQYLLQEGQFVADLLYFRGEKIPNTPNTRENLQPAPPIGYDYDFCDISKLLELEVADGNLAMPNGMRYRALVLPPEKRMTLEVLRKVRELARAGAVIVGPPPVAAYGLAKYPDSDAEVQRLSLELWGESGQQAATGKGMVIRDRPLSNVLASIGCKPDVEFSKKVERTLSKIPGSAYPGPGLIYIHRRIGGRDVYFVSNQSHQPVQTDALFRIEGRLPELWHPESGEIAQAVVYAPTEDRRTQVKLHLDAAESVFIVFGVTPSEKDPIVAFSQPLTASSMDAAPLSTLSRLDGQNVLTAWSGGKHELKTAGGRQGAIEVAPLPSPLKLTGPWNVWFDPRWGGPGDVKLAALTDWSKHAVEGVKHYSGTALYRIDFEVAAETLVPGRVAMLSLGDVQVITEVTLNGKDLGILWKPPFCVEVSDALRVGANRLEVRVTSLWPNRLIGDEAKPLPENWGKWGNGPGILEIPAWLLTGETMPQGERVTFTTWRHFKARDPLLPSGLIGPARIEWGERRPVDLR